MVNLDPNYATAIAAAPSRAEKELLAYNTVYGTNLNYGNIIKDSEENFKALNDQNFKNYSDGIINKEQYESGLEILAEQHQKAGMFSSSDLSILPILETNMVFSYARYIQGSNRLLKDVIRDARKVVQLDGFFNTDRKVMARYTTLFDFFIDKYNQELLKVFSPEEIKANGYALGRDGSAITGGFNTAGTTKSANTYSGAGAAMESMDLKNEFKGFLPDSIIEDIL